MGFNRGSSGISGRRIRCRFCPIRFKYQSVMISHETRIHKAEIKKAEEMEKTACPKTELTGPLESFVYPY